MRTFIINFYKGKNYSGEYDTELIIPEIASRGGSDEEYSRLYEEYDFSKENDLVEAGEAFVKLHKRQTEKAEAKAKNQTLTPSITSSWAIAAGLLQRDKTRLARLYGLPDNPESKDPLKSDILGSARGDDDPPTYRGLVTRSGVKERGRLLQLFLIYSKASKQYITKEMVKLAIEEHHAKEKAQERKNLAKKVY